MAQETKGEDREVTVADLNQLRLELQELESRLGSRFATIERQLQELEWHVDEMLSQIKSSDGSP